jgi:hypothetical protein
MVVTMIKLIIEVKEDKEKKVNIKLTHSPKDISKLPDNEQIVAQELSLRLNEFLKGIVNKKGE